MKILRVRYNVPLGPMMEDLQRVFPNIVVTANELRDRGGLLIYWEKKRFCYVKEKFDEAGVRTHCIVYSLVRDSFVMPVWIQGTVLSESDVNNPIDHYFLGHEIPVPDDPNEPPEDAVIE